MPATEHRAKLRRRVCGTPMCTKWDRMGNCNKCPGTGFVFGCASNFASATREPGGGLSGSTMNRQSCPSYTLSRMLTTPLPGTQVTCCFQFNKPIRRRNNLACANCHRTKQFRYQRAPWLRKRGCGPSKHSFRIPIAKSPPNKVEKGGFQWTEFVNCCKLVFRRGHIPAKHFPGP